MKAPPDEREAHAALSRTQAMPAEQEQSAIEANEWPLTTELWAIIVVVVFEMFVF